MPAGGQTQAEARAEARLWRALNVLVTEYTRAKRWHHETEAEAFATALKIIDACIGALSGADFDRTDFDAQIMRRLGEIAIDRNVLTRLRLVDPPPAAAEPIEAGA
jgi:hypothetical protein